MSGFIEYAPGMFARVGEKRIVDNIEWTFYPAQKPVGRVGWISREFGRVGGRLPPPELRTRLVTKSKPFVPRAGVHWSSTD